jgi:hypothetical protein
MAFGPAPQQQQGGDGERYESRNLTIVSGEEKTTSTGKLYWRVKDSDGKFYTVWESVTKINLEMAAGKGESILCAVKVEKKGDKTFYNITGTGAAAEGLVAAGTAKAQAASQPGGKFSEFGRRMHPDDALRVTHLAVMERALHFIDIIADDRPEDMSRELFAKGKLLSIMQFLDRIVDMPKTITPDAPLPKAEEAPATQAAASGFAGGFSGPTPESVQADYDSDIPF